MRRTLSLALLVACGGDAQPAQPPEPEVELPIYEEGHVVGQVAAPEEEPGDEVRNDDPPENETGLTVVDLGNDYAPGIFAPAPELGELGTPPYREVYVALADERLDALPDHVEPERFLEVFGIFPTFRVLRERLGDTERHACHAAIDPALLHDLPYVIKPKNVDVAADRQRVRAYERELPRFEAERAELGLASLEVLDGVSARRAVQITASAVQELCSGRVAGDVPSSPARAEARRHRLAFDDVDAEAKALSRHDPSGSAGDPWVV